MLKDDDSIFVFIPIIEKQFAIGDFNVLIHEHMNYFTYLGVNLFIKNKLFIDSYYFKNDDGFFKLFKV